MTILILILTPLFGLFFLSIYSPNIPSSIYQKQVKSIGLFISITNLFLSLIMFINFDFACNQFQFVQKNHDIGYYDFYLGTDGLSVYFILLTCMIVPLSLLSNWTSIYVNTKPYVIILLLLETLLLSVFIALDGLLFYVFFESILFPLFILVGLCGSSNKVRASFYLFLYTLIGSLFLLLSILSIYSITGTTDFDSLFKTNFNYYTQFFIFYGIFFSFAIKTPTIFLNSWLLKAHVESPLAGSLILASIVLKLSLYGIVRLILPLLPKAYLDNTYFIYIIGVITIIYASIATLRTTDIKELIAYSSVSHASVYLLGIFSNNIQGIQGAIVFGLAHGFVSSGLFICVGGVLYDRSGNRLITLYKGLAQLMPIFSILFFILCLANAGAPLTFNFIGEFMSLYGAFERLPLLGILASTSIILSAAYSMFMLNRIVFAGSFSKLFLFNISDLNKREFSILLFLTLLTIALGIYPAPIFDSLNYFVSNILYNCDYSLYSCSLLVPLFSFGKNHRCFSSTSVKSNPSDGEYDADIDHKATYKESPIPEQVEQNTYTLVNKYKNKPDELVSHFNKKIDSVCEKSLLFLHEYSSDREELRKNVDPDDLKSYDETTVNEVRMETKRVKEDIEALKRNRDDVIDNMPEPKSGPSIVDNKPFLNKIDARDSKILQQVEKIEQSLINKELHRQRIHHQTSDMFATESAYEGYVYGGSSYSLYVELFGFYPVFLIGSLLCFFFIFFLYRSYLFIYKKYFIK